MNRLRLVNLFTARLSRQIVLWVFASIVVIEAIILVPSVLRRERELLDYLKQISTARAAGLLEAKNLNLDSQQLLAHIQSLQSNALVVGGALYTITGEQVGSFGETPELSFEDFTQAGQAERLYRADSRFDAVWEMSPLDGRYVLIIRHDASGVRDEFFAFIGRITGLVVIISAFVTGATLIVLDRLLISPILTLRRDLLDAGEALSQDETCGSRLEFESVKTLHPNELGDVNAAFKQMVQQISDANTMRKKAEEELRLSEEKFSKAFHCSPNPITITTLDSGQFIDVNDSFLYLFNTTSDETLGRTVADVGLWVNPEDRREMLRVLKQDGFVRNREYAFSTSSGIQRIALFSAERIWINGTDCILAVFNDITERKQAEEALRESEMRFRALVEQAVDAFFVIDGQGRIVDANQQACVYLGYSPEELMHLSVLEIETTATPETFPTIWARLTPGAPITLDGRHRRKDGTIFPVEVRVGVLDFGDEKLILALSRDISERKEAEAAMARLAEIGELASMIVHEVRNPLTTVLMGLSSFSRMDLPERAKARLSLAMEESERLQRLLNEILLYAREQKMDMAELELNALCTEMLESLQELPLACDRAIDFLPSPSPARVWGDRDKLKQVFINLVSNACEAVPRGESVHWKVLNNNGSGQIEVQVQNGGAPIPPEILTKLTQPFFTTKPSGNGLGLAITKRIVEAHGGRLSIESSAARGTVVTVWLPTLT